MRTLDRAGRAVAFVLGCICLLNVLAMCGYFAYLSWFVHPEYTDRMMALTYWREELVTLALVIGAAVCFEQSKDV